MSRLAACGARAERPRSQHVATRGRSCDGGRLPSRCAGFWIVHVRARKAIRLQTSTNGARPRPLAEGDPSERTRSSSNMREHHRANQRRKPDHDGKVVGSVAGPGRGPRKRKTGLGIRRTKALRAETCSFPLTRKRMRRLWLHGFFRLRPVRAVTRQGVSEVVAAQPCTRSKTPRHGGHRPERCPALIRSDEGVSSEPEARWASSSAHRPGAAHPQGCTAPAARLLASKNEAQGPRGRSVAAKAPRSGIGRFAGAWIRSRLQKSVRSISSRSRSRSERSLAPPTATSSARRPLPRRGSVTVSRRAQGCGTIARNPKRACAALHSAQVEPRIGGRRPGS